MAGVNKVILLGNLGADPEVRHLESGGVVANLSIATTESYNKNGQRVDQTEWHKVELWDKLAELAEKYLNKGNTVYIEGKIRTNTYQDKDGNTRYDKRIRATNMTFVGGKNESSDTGSHQASATAQTNQGVPSSPGASSPSQAAMGSSADSNQEDDLPF